MGSFWFSKIPAYYVASILVSFGGLLFGYDTGIIGEITTMDQFANSLGHFSSTVHGLIVSAILIPAAASSFFAGHLADKIGRPRSIAIGGIIFALGCGIESGSVHIAMLIIGRIITGLGEGFFLSTVVVYICEISPAKSRGFLGSCPQLTITGGLCVGYFTCYGTNNMKSSIAWRLPFAIQSLMAITFSLTSFFLLPESPRWLLFMNRKEAAKEAWERLGVPSVDSEKESNDILRVKTLEEAEGEHGLTPVISNSHNRGAGAATLLTIFDKDVRFRTFLAAFMMGMQQLVGIDGVLFYAPLLFEAAGLTSSQASFLASGVSALVIFVVTIPAILVADRWGRRSSTIYGGLGLFLTMFLIGTLYASGSVHADHGAGRWVVIILIYVFAIIYSMTWAVGIKVYASEIQPPRTRAAATSLGQSSNWLVNYIVALTTPIMLAHSSFAAYYLFAGAGLITVVVCAVAMPETRHKTLEEIEEAFEKHHVSVSWPKWKSMKRTLRRDHD